MTTDSQLQYQLHISEPIPFSRPETAPNGERQMFQYIATTLISGAQDAVLVDPPMTTEQTAQVINWVEASGRRSSIFSLLTATATTGLVRARYSSVFPMSRFLPRPARSRSCTITPHPRSARPCGTKCSLI